MIDFTKIRSVHFIGIGGIGTSAIARMFVLEGKKVSGSDMAESEVTTGLREAGATIFIGEDAKNIPADWKFNANPGYYADEIDSAAKNCPR